MNKNIFILFFFIIPQLQAQYIAVSGKIYNSSTNEPVVGATIVNTNNGNSTATNSYGFYSLRIPKNTHITLQITCFGYDTLFFDIKDDRNIEKNFLLTEGIEISEIKVTANKSNNQSEYSITQAQIKALPSLTSDFDVLKSFQYMPGIQFGAEGTSNLYVLGGTPDQNLITIDDIPLFYVTHLGNFVSIFDIEAVREAKLVKSGFSPKYGGKQASFIDIILKDGDMKKHNFNFNIGLLSSKFSSNGYIIKDKISYIATIRRSNIDIGYQFLQLVNKEYYAVVNNFYDANFKLNYKLNDNNKLQYIFYSGSDRFKAQILTSDANQIIDIPGEEVSQNYIYKDKELFKWGNLAYGLKWLFNKNIFFANTTTGFSKYNFDFSTFNQTIADYDSILKTVSTVKKSYIGYYFAKTNCSFNLSNSLMFFLGAEYNYYLNQPVFFSNLTQTPFASIYYEISENKYSQNLISAYLDFNYNFKRKLLIKTGIRSSFFDNKYFHSPRLRLFFTAGKHLKFYISYAKTFQFIHLLQTSTTIVPSDIWILSKNNAIPEYSNLFDFNFMISFDNLNFTIGTFSKKMYNLIDYKRIIYNTTISLWDRLEYFGTGNAYGAYFSGKYSHTKININFSYSFTINTRFFKELNNGLPFPNYYTRKHYLNLTFIYKINKHWQTSALFIFASGMPYTLPAINHNTLTQLNYISNYSNAYTKLYLYSLEIFTSNSINNYTLPAYHRLDIAIKYSWKNKSGKIDNNVSLNIYNAYNHMNPYFVC